MRVLEIPVEQDQCRDRGNISQRARQLATWLFVIPIFFGYARPPNAAHVYLHTGDVAMISMAGVLLYALYVGVPKGSAFSVTVATVLCAALVIGYSFIWPWMRGNAYATPSDKLAISAAASCVFAIAYAKFLYCEKCLVDIFWRVANAAVIVALAAYAARGFTGGWLVHQQYGTPRLEGFLSEPSGWAFSLPGLLLLSLERRRYLVTMMAIVATFATKSPTVILATTLSITVYLLISGRCERARKEVVLFLTFLWVGAVIWIRSVPIVAQTKDSSYFDQVVVRLAAGITGVTSNGTEGRNERFSSTQAVIDQLNEHHWLYTGIGPGFESYLFYSTGGMLPNALPVYLLGSFGILGVAYFAFIFIRTAWSLRRAASFALFLPFMITSLINSAGGWESFKVVIVGAATVAGLFSVNKASTASDNGSRSKPMRDALP